MLSIKHEGFLESLSTNLSRSKSENSFTDITLISDEAESFHAHKFVLASCSSFFGNIFKNNTRSHPLLFLNGVTSKDIRHILNFVYEGKVEIENEQLKSFMSIAEKLKIDGLIREPNEEKQKDKSGKDIVLIEESHEDTQNVTSEKDFDFLEDSQEDEILDNSMDIKTEPEESILGKLSYDIDDTSDLGNKEAKRKEESDSRETLEPMKKQKIYCYEKIHLSDVSEIRPKIEELSEKVDGVWRCKFCGKTLTAGSKKQELGAHIETHFEGLSFQCDLCDKITNNRNSLRKHKYRSHKQNK